MRLLAIDPGSEESAYVEYDLGKGRPVAWGKVPNERMLKEIGFAAMRLEPLGLAIEMVASYGMAVGATVFETCVWAGRFIERCSAFTDSEPIRVYRRDVKLHLCGSQRAKDANIRQALIDRYGPGKERAVGLKASPGPLYGMKADCWQALAVAVTAAEAMFDARAAA